MQRPHQINVIANEELIIRLEKAKREHGLSKTAIILRGATQYLDGLEMQRPDSDLGGAARAAAYDAAYDVAAYYAACGAAAVVVKDLISDEQFAALTAPWNLIKGSS